VKIAIIGTGIAGNVAAHRLAPEHQITVYEADNRIGGHTHTVDLRTPHGDYPVDTGFIVFNDATYPNFIALLDELGVASKPSVMSFSVRCERYGLEYNGASLNALFAQRRNILRPSFYRMLLDILRFNREAKELLETKHSRLSLNEYLDQNRYSHEFKAHYILPMGAAIWSASPQGMGEVPAEFFIRFFHNHGLLSLNDRPQWRVIEGGSRAYVDKLVAGHRDRIRVNTPVEWIKRGTGNVVVKARGAEPERYDRVFLACHSDQALALLADPSPLERRVLGAIRYQLNEAVLHTDDRLMPRLRRAWAAWNYHISGQPGQGLDRAALTYNMNMLQSLESPAPFLVTLNHTRAIDPARIIKTIHYSHPIFTERAVAAQQQHRALNGVLNTYYCGAYWRNGFHEDGVVSALTALRHLKSDLGQPDQRTSMAA